MFIALTSIIINSISDVFRKKSLWYWVWWKVHDLMWHSTWTLIAIYFLFIWIDFTKIDKFLLILTVTILIIEIFKNQIYQNIYKKEKISLIIPYTNVNKILTIILSFFIFADVSLVALLITFVAIFVIISFSINLKTLKLPKNISLLLFWEVIWWCLSLTIWWIIINYWVNLYFSISLITWTLFLLILSLILWEFKTLKWLDSSFYKNRILSSTWRIWTFLSMVVIKELWLSVWILLSFLWIWITLFFSFLLLWDIPRKKDIFLTIIVSALVWLWFFLK